MTWTVYVLECSDGTLYTGITKDLTRRLDAHQKGHGAKYTRGRGPFKIFYNHSISWAHHNPKCTGFLDNNHLHLLIA